MLLHEEGHKEPAQSPLNHANYTCDLLVSKYAPLEPEEAKVSRNQYWLNRSLVPRIKEAKLTNKKEKLAQAKSKTSNRKQNPEKKTSSKTEKTKMEIRVKKKPGANSTIKIISRKRKRSSNPLYATQETKLKQLQNPDHRETETKQSIELIQQSLKTQFHKIKREDIFMRNYHNSLTSLALPGINNEGNTITLRAHQTLGHNLPRIFRRPYENDVAGPHFAKSMRNPLSKDNITGKVQGRKHTGSVGLQHTRSIPTPQQRTPTLSIFLGYQEIICRKETQIDR
uniref:Mitochondrial inner membrane protease subunit 1 n=1 Tax=Rhizophora mucronata TaxID=61149 RepID=A0A2P2JUD9_RHIMU